MILRNSLQRYQRLTAPAIGLVGFMLSGWLPLVAQELQPIPELRSRVTDLTATLDSQQQASLEARLQALEKSKGSQIAVVIVETTSPETIEAY